ncbi:hypothetical protein ACI7BZ_04105 [Xanthobacter sp. AM11]|uniref:hypothetical protein n=1 Tax=Xanthobacter sp. AM11 TaxID=3380643 RepID=UPI0039BFC2BA
MTGPRHSEGPPGHGGWPASATPHGYDRTEFGPGESRRDFPPRRRREPDEERRLLREAQAAFEGPDRRSDVDADGDKAWDEDAAPDAMPSRAGTGKSVRLYRE